MFKATVVAVVLAIAMPSVAFAQAKKAPAKKGAAKAPTAAEIAALGSDQVEAAAKAAETIGESSSPAAHDALLDALAMGLPASVAVPAIVGLAKHPAPPDVQALVRYANHINPTVRNAAITALAQYPDPAAHKVVIERLGDSVAVVRATAAAAAAKAKIKKAVDPMLVLLSRGEEPAARALAAMADVELAARIADQLGKVPAESLALCLGAILLRPDFGPDTARVEVVRAIGKIDDRSAVTALQDYLANSPKKPTTSRTEAQMIVDARLGGGK
ncbi:MAG: HEAT repeat domain-containing protein [Kofleriaceae bacterium]